MKARWDLGWERVSRDFLVSCKVGAGPSKQPQSALHGRCLMRRELKVDSRYSSVTFLNQRTPLFELYVVKCGSKSGYRKDILLPFQSKSYVWT